MNHKICSKCKTEKELTEFYKNKAQKSGYDNYCKSCKRASSKKWKNENPDKQLSYQKNYRENHPSRVKSQKNAAIDKNREHYKNYLKVYKQENKERINAHNGARSKRVKQATPCWVNLVEIYNIYLNRPEGYHVDHVIPLHGENVCGLHVPWNLQYLPAKDNLQKGRRL